MLVNQAFKFRLYPTPAQEKLLAQQFGAARFVYNHFLRQRLDDYAAHKGEKKQSLNYHDTARMLTELKRQPAYDWLNETSSQALQAALRDLDAAYRNFFEQRTEFPKFKSKRGKQAFQVPQHFRLDADAGQLRLPKLAPLKIVVHRPMPWIVSSISSHGRRSKSCSTQWTGTFWPRDSCWGRTSDNKQTGRLRPPGLLATPGGR